MVDEKSWLRQKGESSKSYGYFKTYLEMGATRSVERLWGQLGKKHRKEPDKYKKPPTRKALENTCSKHEWVKRAIDYDNFITLQDYLYNEESFHKNNRIAQDFTKENMLLLKDIRDEIQVNANDNAPTTRSSALLNLSRAWDLNYKNFRLAHGRSTEIKDENISSTIKADLEVEKKEEVSVFDMISEVDEILGDVDESSGDNQSEENTE